MLTLDPPAVRRLYATYSNVTALPADERERLLSGLEKVAETEFAGVVSQKHDDVGLHGKTRVTGCSGRKIKLPYQLEQRG